jgi:tartrate-resistant acid phosphatase type 5
MTFFNRFDRLLGCLLAATLLAACGNEGPAASAQTAQASATAAQESEQPLRLAVVGDYGTPTREAADVAALIKSWNPHAILTTGDNNYPSGAAATIDRNIGAYYHAFIAPYRGAYGAGTTENRFFPTLGNHDWDTPGARPYLDYFSLPGNERYYEKVLGKVHLFALDSDPREPDGVSPDSVQGVWLRNAMAASTACWKIVVMHHPPYSSGAHGSSAWMQWPYREWGADLVLTGHDHTYERVVVGGLTYIVSGLGGNTRYSFGAPVAGSVERYNGDVGAVLVEVVGGVAGFSFVTRGGEVVDRGEIRKECS